MASTDNAAPSHDHVFGQDQRRPGERRTLLVVVLTATMMVGEIAAGILFGSMALLADGLHMASHTLALGLAVAAYVVARRLAHDPRFSFGVGKINALAAFSSAVLLLGFAFAMVFESTDRLLFPVAIDFDHALIVAVLGLIVNAVSALILIRSPDGHDHGHGHHHHGHGHGHGHGHDHHDHGHHHHGPGHGEHHGLAHADAANGNALKDHNLRAAYLHVLADALTSVLAIVALLAGKWFGARWLDPAMGLLGAALVTRWGVSLLKETSAVLLDRQIPADELGRLKARLEGGDAQVLDLHVWHIGNGIRAAEVVVETDQSTSPDAFRARLPADSNIRHATIEVRSSGR